MISRKLLAGSLGLTFGITLVALANSASRASQVQQVTPDGGVGPAIPSPTEWVPFAAEAKAAGAHSGGAPHVRFQGRYFRRSDGSTRFETGPESGPIRTIDIKNITQNRYYLFENDRWQSHPMLLPDEGFSPKQRREDMRGLETVPERVSGFVVYRYTDRGGVVSLKAPDLNFFAVRTSFQGSTQEFYDIQIGEQADDLFEPPKGTEVAHSTEPRGIISRKKREALRR